MYRHHLLRVNHTTYDVRRAQDIINPGTSHRDIMMLANNSDGKDSEDVHPFCYARVLGIFHVNVIYTGTGMHDYTARRLNFLWVRWYQYSEARSIRWSDYRLDSLHFPPMSHEHAFGFVDPQDVLRACHVLPAFKDGRSHPDGISISRCAGDGTDWRRYFANRCVGPCPGPFLSSLRFRFVDRDMMMRYHWGLAIGHVYANQSSCRVDEAVNNMESIGEPIDEDDQDQEASFMMFGGVDTESLEHSLVMRDIDDLGDESSTTSETIMYDEEFDEE